MKTIKSTFILLLIASLSFISCDDEPLEGTFSDELNIDNGSGNGASGNTAFFANVGGVEFVENALTTVESSGLISITAAQSTGTMINIAMPSDVAIGVYSFNGAASQYVSQYIISGTPIVSTISDSGSLEITAHDTVARTITGTFNFVSTPVGVTTPEYSITDGTFNVSY